MDFYALLGCCEVCEVVKGCAFWSTSVDFYILFGLVGGFCGAEKYGNICSHMILRAHVSIL